MGGMEAFARAERGSTILQCIYQMSEWDWPAMLPGTPTSPGVGAGVDFLHKLIMSWLSLNPVKPQCVE